MIRRATSDDEGRWEGVGQEPGDSRCFVPDKFTPFQHPSFPRRMDPPESPSPSPSRSPSPSSEFDVPWEALEAAAQAEDAYYDSLEYREDNDSQLGDDDDEILEADHPIPPEEVLEDEGPRPALQRGKTAELYQKLRADVASYAPGSPEAQQNGMPQRVQRVLDAIKSEGMNLSIFLDVVSFGDAACRRDGAIRHERDGLLHGVELPGILLRWWKPPKSANSNKSRPRGAKVSMEAFAATCMRERLDRELDGLATLLSSPAGPDVELETLTGTTFEKLIAQVRTLAPNLWALIYRMSYTDKQEENNTHKKSEKVGQVLAYGLHLADNNLRVSSLSSLSFRTVVRTTAIVFRRCSPSISSSRGCRPRDSTRSTRSVSL